MKLKQRLADEFYISKVGTRLPGKSWKDATDMIFLSGFEKAREMALELAAQETCWPLCISKDDLLYCTRGCETFHKMSKLGEEEV